MPQFVAGRDSEPLRQPTVDLEDRDHAAAAVDRRLIEGNRILVDAGHDPILTDEDHVERNKRVLHPEGHVAGRVIQKQHSAALRHLGHMHQAAPPLFRIIGNIDREPRLAPVAAQLDKIRLAGRIGGASKKPRRGRQDYEESLSAASQLVTCTAIRPRAPSTTRNDTASPG